MDASDNECAHKQGGHSPERPEQERVFCRIVMGRVRQVSRKSPRGAFVTLLARCEDSLPAQMGAGVRNGQNIVRPVTIVALGCFRVSQL